MKVIFTFSDEISTDVADHVRSEGGFEFATLKDDGCKLIMAGNQGDSSDALGAAIRAMIALGVNELVTGLDCKDVSR